jgi:hypothetical protein
LHDVPVRVVNAPSNVAGHGTAGSFLMSYATVAVTAARTNGT